MLRSGAAEVRDAQGSLVDRGGEGSCFGSTSLTQGNPSTFDVTAIEDCLALLLPAEDFHRLCTDHPEVDAFFDAQRASRMSGAVASLQLSSTGSAILKTRVRDLVGREPVAVATTATVREAAKVMSSTGCRRCSSCATSSSPASSPTATCAPGFSQRGSTPAWRSPR